MRVIGTAGHVDHGKSALVAALTGTHPDRLKEEQAREMTIELGFAWFTLPDGEDVGVVDVPGHRDFIENMLSGVGGIDAALFVVAADEGVMPQTREHLAILDILQIGAGVIALTKCDLIDEEEWLDLVEMDVRSALDGTVLAEAPLVRVSARTGLGMDNLVQALQDVLAGHPPRPDLGRARLPIDRVFTLAGFGTVVTGTLVDGSLRQGEEVEILPRGLRGRVRGLQSHKRKVDQALPGSRAAVNVSGVDVDALQRGDVLTSPGRYRPTQRIDVHFRLLPDASSPLKHSAEVKFFVGASEVVARVRLLGREELLQGDEGWLQLDLQEPVVTVRGDRYILRRPSPAETMGGGVVVDPHPGRRHRRFSGEILRKLEALRYGSPADILFQAALDSSAAPMRAISSRSRLGNDVLEQALNELMTQEQLLQLEPGQLNPTAELLVCAKPQWLILHGRVIEEVSGYHRTFPLRLGMPREELKSKLKLSAKVFMAVMRYMTAQGELIEKGTLIALSSHRLEFTTQQQAAIKGLMKRFAQTPFAPPSVKEIQDEVGNEVLNALVETGELIQVSADVVFRQPDYQTLLRWIDRHFETNDTLTVAQFRDEFNTSRRYALGFLEHLDSIEVTMRSGDARRLRKTSDNR
jgi:selenocysteine-specific elongation factor